MEKDQFKIILASKSERRKEILTREGFDFEIYVPHGNEKDIIGKKYSEELVNECAREKAENAYNELYGVGSQARPYVCVCPDGEGHAQIANTIRVRKFASTITPVPTITPAHTIIVSCDTVVVNDGVIIGKPKDKDDAKRILKSLSGSRHRVISAVCICKDGKYYVENDTTYVNFRILSDEEIENYINERKPYDKAGSYGIQDEKFDFVESIEGSMNNVVGFPIELFIEMIGKL